MKLCGITALFKDPGSMLPSYTGVQLGLVRCITRGQFKFSLIFSSVSTAKRQSLQPTEVQVDPTGLDTSVTTTHTLTNVGAGSYSASVMAVNENGASQAIMSATFVVESTLVSANRAAYMCSVFCCLRTMSVCHCTCMTIS